MKHINANDPHHIGWMGYTALDSHGHVVYSMPGVRFTVTISGASRLTVRMNGGKNIFHVKSSSVSTIIQTENDLRDITLLSNLDPKQTYHVSVTKRTEPELRYPMSSFLPVSVSHLSIDSGTFHSVNAKDAFYPKGWLEIIGDSDACGFGVEGEISSLSNFFSMDPLKENVELGWGFQLCDLLGYGAVTVAASGKGIFRNAPFCGDTTLVDMYEAESSCPKLEKPKAVIVLAGGNDFSNHTCPNRAKFVNEFTRLIASVKRRRGGDVPIILVQCSSSCCSSAGSPSEHSREDPDVRNACLSLEEVTREVVAKCGGAQANVYFHLVDVELSLQSDYGIMMHWNANGQQKIAQSIASFVTDSRLIPNH